MMNIMNPPADWSTLKKLIWLRGTPTTGGEELIVSGTPPLSLPNSLGKPLKAWEVTLSPYQDLHGYDNPWPAGGGKNIAHLGSDNIYSEQQNTHSFANNGVIVTSTGNYGRVGFSFPVVTGETYTVSAKCKRGNVNIVRIGLSDETGWNDSYNPLVSSGQITETLTLFTKTITATSDILSLEAYAGGNGAVVTIEDFQVEKSSSYTSFAPYANICPILGTDKLNVFVEESYDQSATPKTVITFDNTLYGGTYDAVSGVGTITWASVDLGALTWTNVGSATYRIWRANLQDAKTSTSSAGLRNAICSNYVLATNGVAIYNGSEDKCFIINSTYLGGMGFIYVRDSDYDNATESDVKTALNGVQVVYELESPIPFTTDGHTIKLPKGTASTWATAEDGVVDGMEVTYVGKA